MTEDGLKELLEFIQGKRPVGMHGRGITTWPDHDSDQKHVACLELERRGLIKRHLDREAYVTWMPVE
jgi:hypothetical protein